MMNLSKWGKFIFDCETEEGCAYQLCKPDIEKSCNHPLSLIPGLDTRERYKLGEMGVDWCPLLLIQGKVILNIIEILQLKDVGLLKMYPISIISQDILREEQNVFILKELGLNMEEIYGKRSEEGT